MGQIITYITKFCNRIYNFFKLICSRTKLNNTKDQLHDKCTESTLNNSSSKDNNNMDTENIINNSKLIISDEVMTSTLSDEVTSNEVMTSASSNEVTSNEIMTSESSNEVISNEVISNETLSENTKDTLNEINQLSPTDTSTNVKCDEKINQVDEEYVSIDELSFDDDLKIIKNLEIICNYDEKQSLKINHEGFLELDNVNTGILENIIRWSIGSSAELEDNVVCEIERIIKDAFERSKNNDEIKNKLNMSIIGLNKILNVYNDEQHTGKIKKIIEHINNM